MNTLLLDPTDVLFFRDGRPMGGASSGHGAAWPLPTVINAALHAALHRAEIESTHAHRRGRSGNYSDNANHRDRKFGSLVTAGPFPILADGSWLFPRPLDAASQSSAVTLAPTSSPGPSSLPAPLCFPVGSTTPPNKEKPAAWWSSSAWQAYLEGRGFTESTHFLADSDFADPEFTFGIGIDPDTGTQDGERFYSAHYLRLKPGCRIGLLAEAMDKIDGDASNKRDLIANVFPNAGTKTPVIVGGQQRVCTVERRDGKALPLPLGATISGTRVKWVLLTPAIFPAIEAGMSKRGTMRNAHPGGWLPTWICPESGKVLLQTIDEVERKRRRALNAKGEGYPSKPNIPAKLVAALTGKPIPVTGYALPNEADPDREIGGAKSTHLAVPAGSVYYFEAESPDAAHALAAALNWHGSQISNSESQISHSTSQISNRRSTLMGEKGFGLGVCGTWDFLTP